MHNLKPELITLGRQYDFDPIATGGGCDYLNYFEHPDHHFVLGAADDYGHGDVDLSEPVVLCCYQKNDEEWQDANVMSFKNAETAMRFIFEKKGEI